jgi:ubiquitin thioesterase protein OTUB1
MDESTNPHGVDAQQDAAMSYRQVLEGPFVGDKTPIDAITQEYATASPIYVEKTMALARTYSHYRPIQGDGNCGWRAIGFSYYEKLVEMGDQMQIEGEVARLTSFNQVFENVGGYTYIEDWADEAIGLLRDLAAHLHDGSASRILIDRWNDGAAGSIIYYLRLLAATNMKLNPDSYLNFIAEPDGISGYCSRNIEPVDREIEHVSIVALAGILLEPVGLFLEIAVLDQTPGSEVNSYRPLGGQSNGPMVHLLYKPDHYDILYSVENNQPVAAASNASAGHTTQVHRVDAFTHNMQIESNSGFHAMDTYALVNMPNFAPAVMSPMAPPLPTSPINGSYSSGPDTPQHSPWGTGQYADNNGVTGPMHNLETHPESAPSISILPGACINQQGLAHRIASPEYHIRFSPVQLDYNEGKNHFPEQSQVTTSTFKNSVYNRAHFGNPDFHPEEWSPEEEGLDAKMVGKKKVKKEVMS